jgi:hypothetical protein
VFSFHRRSTQLLDSCRIGRETSPWAASSFIPGFQTSCALITLVRCESTVSVHVLAPVVKPPPSFPRSFVLIRIRLLFVPFDNDRLSNRETRRAVCRRGRLIVMFWRPLDELLGPSLVLGVDRDAEILGGAVGGYVRALTTGADGPPVSHPVANRGGILLTTLHPAPPVVCGTDEVTTFITYGESRNIHGGSYGPHGGTTPLATVSRLVAIPICCRTNCRVIRVGGHS